MLYPKKKKLDPGSITEYRMMKMEDQRLATANLMINLSRYSLTLQQLSTIETDISKDLMKLYTHDSIFSNLIFNLQKVLEFKSDIIKRETKSLKDAVDKNKGLMDVYKPLKPLFKHYFKSMEQNDHYVKKLPKLIDFLEGRKKMKGELTKRETAKLIRNKRKLENAQTDLKIVQESVIAETNKVNVDRFGPLSKVAKDFINTELSTTYLMTEKFTMLQDFESILATKETENFNNAYFIDTKQESKSRYMKSVTKMGRNTQEETEVRPLKQNIQNNYYYITADEKAAKEKFSQMNDPMSNKDQRTSLIQITNGKKNHGNDVLYLEDNPKEIRGTRQDNGDGVLALTYE